MTDNEAAYQPVILFDGFCNLCSSSVQFVIKHDPEGIYKFASLQSNFGSVILKQFNLPATELNSFILYQNDKIYTRSTGALMVAKKLNGPWRGLGIFLLVPRFIRDFVYKIISKNRYKWFGQKTTCWLPSPALRKRFIS